MSARLSHAEVMEIVFNAIEKQRGNVNRMAWSDDGRLAREIATEVLARPAPTYAVDSWRRSPSKEGPPNYFPAKSCQCGAQRVSLTTRHSNWCPLLA